MNEYYSDPGCIQELNNKSGQLKSNHVGSITLSPNPVNDELILSLSKEWDPNQKMQITFVDAMGRNSKIDIHNISERKYALDVTSLANGLYYIQVNSGTRIEVSKIIVSH